MATFRETALDALRDLLLDKNWRTVTMTHVASAAGVSRQTLYNEFGSRNGLAQGYAIRITDLFVDAVESALHEHPGNANAALQQGFHAFFSLAAGDPLVKSLHSGEAPEDLLRLITTDSAVIIDRASARLSDTLQNGWVGASTHIGGVLGRAIVRLALSYISALPPDAESVSHDMAQLLSPTIESIRN